MDARPCTLCVGGIERTALVIDPTVASDSPPLVVGFHGKGSTAQAAIAAFDLSSFMPEALCVFPQGLNTPSPLDRQGLRSGWDYKATQNRDLDLFDAILGEFPHDNNRVYAVGHSNGAGFVYHLWRNRGEVLAALGASGSSGGGNKTMGPPIGIFHVAGQNDTVVKFASQQAYVARICEILGLPPGVSEGPITRFGDALALYVHSQGHSFDRKALPLVAEFLRRHQRNRKAP